MGFYMPDDTDEIGKAQIKALEALEAQMLLSMKTKLRFAGLTFTNRFAKPDTDDDALLGYWEGMQSVFHSIGGVHMGILQGNSDRKAAAVREEGQVHD